MQPDHFNFDFNFFQSFSLMNTWSPLHGLDDSLCYGLVQLSNLSCPENSSVLHLAVLNHRLVLSSYIHYQDFAYFLCLDYTQTPFHHRIYSFFCRVFCNTLRQGQDFFLFSLFLCVSIKTVTALY